MKNELNEIFDNTIPHSTFLSKSSIDSCMMQSYILGRNEKDEEYDKLKNAFEDLLEMWGDFGKYNSSRNHMEEDWKKQAGLL
jgi:hypothetical protein